MCRSMQFCNAGGHCTVCDVQKAFDYPVLLERLFDGEMWRLLRCWYKCASGCVRIDGRSSVEFPTERRVNQGSALSSSLFLLVIDPLLMSLENLALVSLWMSPMQVASYAGDIRTVVSSRKSLEAQVALVERFTGENFLKLNSLKCEMVVFGRVQTKTVVNSRDNERCGSALQYSESSSCTATPWCSASSKKMW